MNKSLAGFAAVGAGIVFRKLMTREVEMVLRRNGVDPRVAPFAAAGIVGLILWAATQK